MVLPRLRKRLKADQLVAGATIALAAILAVVGAAHAVALLLPVMAAAGFAQMTVMSSLNIAAQQVLPAWVRGRGLAVFLLVFQLGFAAGAAAWGVVAARYGIQVTMSAAAAAMLLTTLLTPFFRLSAADHVDSRPAYRPEPHVPVQVDPSDGPVMVTVEYDIAAGDADALIVAARRLGQVRRREGAVHWALFSDVENPGTHVESFLVTSWAEHQRQADRRTARDQQVLDEIRALHRSQGKPPERYLLGLHRRS